MPLLRSLGINVSDSLAIYQGFHWRPSNAVHLLHHTKRTKDTGSKDKRCICLAVQRIHWKEKFCDSKAGGISGYQLIIDHRMPRFFRLHKGMFPAWNEYRQISVFSMGIASQLSRNGYVTSGVRFFESSRMIGRRPRGYLYGEL